jgi:non-heme chloroperoxidase
VLVGFSMGTGKAVLLAPVPPFLLRTADNPEGVPGSVFDQIMKAIVADRPAYLKAFLDDFYNVNVLGGIRVSDEAVQLSWNVAAGASATLDCVAAWLTDFRDDRRKIDVPTLIVQGDRDRNLPINATGKRLPALLKDAQLEVIEGAAHQGGQSRLAGFPWQVTVTTEDIA